MTTIKCVAGDTGDVRTVNLGGLALTGATAAQAHVRRKGEANVVVPATLNIPAGTVALNLGPFLGSAAVLALTTDTNYELEVQVTFPAGAITWPSGAPDLVRVRPQKA